MKTFEQLCNAIAENRKEGGYNYNWGHNYIGVTFDTSEQMNKFINTSVYDEIRKYEVPTQYSNFLLFRN